MGNAKGAGKRRGRKGKYKLVSPAKVGVQGRTHQTRFLPWIPDQVRDDDRGVRRGRGETQRALRQIQARLSRESGSPGPHALNALFALDPGSSPG